MKEETKCYCGHTTYCDCGPEEPFRHKVVTIPAEEILANRSNAYEFINFDKQETLEEAFDRIFDSLDYILFDFTSFEQGAKWQQERICDSEVIQRIRATLSDAEARRIIRTI